MARQPLVSVITPVHNGAQYLAECIESVLGQRYEHWDYTILDNCSTDASREIAQRYADKDPRIRVAGTDKLLDVMQSQNTAFRQISPDSDYCKMVHADDWLFPSCLAQMVEVAEAHSNVGLVGAYQLEDPWVACDGLPYHTKVASGREVCRSILLGGPGVWGAATSVLVRSVCVRERYEMFDETDFHSDSAAWFEILQRWDFGFAHQVLTYRRRHSESQTSYAERINTFLAADLRRMITYGPACLTPEEYQAGRSRILGQYYRFLAKSLLQPHGVEAWRYHQKALAQMGYPLSWWRMARFVVPFWWHAVRHPARLLKLVRHLPRALKATEQVSLIPRPVGHGTERETSRD